ncbi:MAG TPA: sensor histidine kinase [Solirubrobacterales bacterium]|nr:sensor histidine kinase [Solirubrobacterales bacterium]
MTNGSAQRVGFCHEAFFYGDSDEFLTGTVPFIEEGVAAGETVLVVVPEPRLRLLRGTLGAAGDEVDFLPMEKVGRNPARLVSACGDLLRGNDAERGIRGVGEPIFTGRSAPELDECERHERLLNIAFGEDPALTLMCPYDTNALDDEVLAQAERSHPYCSGPQGRSTSERFAPGNPLAGSLPKREVPAATLGFGKSDLRTVRRAVTDLAHSAGLSPRRNEDLVLAVCEVATNSIQHGGGGGLLAIWRDGGQLVCDIHDFGCIEDPLVGRERVPTGQGGGRGLWIANQLCDLVQIRSGEKGTYVRLRMGIDR